MVFVDVVVWVWLRLGLWFDVDDLVDVLVLLLVDIDGVVLLVCMVDGEVIGFVEVWLCCDYVNGIDSLLVGFFEGWYV